MKSKSVDRLKEYISQKGMIVRNFERSINKSNGYLNGITNIPSNVLEEILEIYEDLSAEWLLRGTGKMILEDNEKQLQNANEEFERRISIINGIYEEKIIELHRQVMKLQSEIMMKTQ